MSSDEPAARPSLEREAWGLMPERQPGETIAPVDLLRYWFVHFNPLYFVSAFCLLCGVYLVSRNVGSLDPESPARAERLLFAIVQAYELLVIGGAAFLVHRVGVVRPAVLLLLLETALLFDCTFRLETLVPMGTLGKVLMLGWVLLTVAKVWAMAACMRIPLTARHYASIAGAAALLAATIHFLILPSPAKPLVLQLAAWAGALLILLLRARRFPTTSPLAQNAIHAGRAARCVRGALKILTAAYFWHLWSYIWIATSAETGPLPLLPQAGAFFLAYALVREEAAAIWRFGLLVLAASLPVVAAVPYATLVIGAVFAYRTWTGARAHLALGAVIAFYVGFRLHGGESRLALDIGLVLCLIAVAWFLDDLLAATLAGAVLFYGFYRAGRGLLPRTELGVGMLLVGTGFLTFLIGLLVNWWLRSPPPGSATRRQA
jgi:hypothetical protein